MRAKAAIFGVIFPVIIVLDWITKRWALDALSGRVWQTNQRGEIRDL